MKADEQVVDMRGPVHEAGGDNLAELARAAGLTVVLDGMIGRERYESVTGSLHALRRFAELFEADCRIRHGIADEQESGIRA